MCEHLWWLFCILCVFHPLKAKKLQPVHEKDATHSSTKERILCDPHMDVLAEKDESYGVIKDSRE